MKRNLLVFLLSLPCTSGALALDCKDIESTLFTTINRGTPYSEELLESAQAVSNAPVDDLVGQASDCFKQGFVGTSRFSPAVFDSPSSAKAILGHYIAGASSYVKYHQAMIEGKKRREQSLAGAAEQSQAIKEETDRKNAAMVAAREERQKASRQNIEASQAGVATQLPASSENPYRDPVVEAEDERKRVEADAYYGVDTSHLTIQPDDSPLYQTETLERCEAIGLAIFNGRSVKATDEMISAVALMKSIPSEDLESETLRCYGEGYHGRMVGTLEPSVLSSMYGSMLLGNLDYAARTVADELDRRRHERYIAAKKVVKEQREALYQQAMVKRREEETRRKAAKKEQAKKEREAQLAAGKEAMLDNCPGRLRRMEGVIVSDETMKPLPVSDFLCLWHYLYPDLDLDTPMIGNDSFEIEYRGEGPTSMVFERLRGDRYGIVEINGERLNAGSRYLRGTEIMTLYPQAVRNIGIKVLADKAVQ